MNIIFISLYSAGRNSLAMFRLLILLFFLLIIFITYSIWLFDRHRGGRDHCGNVTEQQQTSAGHFRATEPPSVPSAQAHGFLRTRQDAYRKFPCYTNARYAWL